MTRLAPDPLAAYAAALRAMYDVLALPRARCETVDDERDSQEATDAPPNARS